ncbi:MAG: TonB-dependent siderophore receptor [Pseudomonadota bacterium]
MKHTYLAASISAALMILSTITHAEEVPSDTSEASDYEVIQIVGSSRDSKTGLSRTNVELEDMSRSVQIFGEEIIEVLQPQSIEEIVTLSSNTAYSGDSNGRGETFSVRGFDAPILKDGIRIDGIPAPEIYDIESVEILKGPDSIMFGEGNPGGLVNYTKKKPKMENHGEFEVEYISNPGFSYRADFGGAISDSGNLRYRLVGVYEDDEDIKDFNTKHERVFIAPSLAFDFNENHTVTFWGEYLDEEVPNEWGSLLNTQGEILVRPETVIGHPDSFKTREQQNFGVDFVSVFGDWTTSLKYTRQDYDLDFGNVLLPIANDPEAGTVTRAFATQAQHDVVDIVQITANTEFELSGMTNRLSFGYDFRSIETDFAGVFFPGAMLVLDAMDPVYEDSLPTIEDYPGAFPYGGPSAAEQTGFFVQNYMDLTEQLVLSLGARYSESDPEGGQKSDATTPQIGLVYKVTDDLSFYANYSKSFMPTTSTDRDSNILDPEEGKGYEVGTRYFISDWLNVTAAIFKIEKDNVPIPDPDFDIFFISGGLQESQGVEFDIAGEIKPGWSLLVSYGYVDTEDKGNNPGKELTSTPNHNANFLTTYNLDDFGFPAFNITGDIKYIGERYANDDNSVSLPDVVVYNVSITYDEGPITAVLSVKNLTDKEYVKNSWGTGRGAEIGDPRQVVASVSYAF